jgi:hypothetical protein
MDERVFYLHEDEWAMIDFLPAENYAESLRIAREAEAFGAEHFDGFGWTDMYVIPKPTVPLASRAIPLDALQTILTERFLPAERVQSGYSTYREDIPNGFAFIEAAQGDEAFYGNQEDGLVKTLHLLPFVGQDETAPTWLIDCLHTLGTTYDLVLADWWQDAIIDLRERDKVVQYLEAALSSGE